MLPSVECSARVSGKNWSGLVAVALEGLILWRTAASVGLIGQVQFARGVVESVLLPVLAGGFIAVGRWRKENRYLLGSAVLLLVGYVCLVKFLDGVSMAGSSVLRML
jgi:hypothetical protein